ncbi:transposase [Treponema sp.]|uniref:transposase n=1 Tax=Treponema sp. TaxID=166 RepID=UPI003FD7759B
MGKQKDRQFKLDAVKYRQEHSDLSTEECAKNLKIGHSTLCRWIKEFEDTGDVKVVGSGNYETEIQKENARLKRELRDAKDALEILKKAIGILGD